MTRIRNVVLAIATVVALSGAGCNYFKPADPERQTAPQQPADYSSPEATLETVRQAVENKGQQGGSVNYIGAFSDSTLHTDIPGFHQAFWPDDAAIWASGHGGNQPPDWNFPKERNFFDAGTNSLVKLRPEKYQMVWDTDPLNTDLEGVSPSLLHRRYTILAIGQDGDVADLIARGFADLTFYKSANGNWYITRWEDRADPDVYNPTFPQVTLGQRRLEY